MDDGMIVDDNGSGVVCREEFGGLMNDGLTTPSTRHDLLPLHLYKKSYAKSHVQITPLSHLTIHQHSLRHGRQRTAAARPVFWAAGTAARSPYLLLEVLACHEKLFQA